MGFFLQLLLGIFGAAQLLVIFRGFFTLTQTPFFHLPLIFLFLGLEFIYGFYFHSKTRKEQNIRKSFYIPIFISSIYILFLSLLITFGKTILGIPFSENLPWYAITIYPLLIFLPISISSGIFCRFILKKINISFILLGFGCYFLMDFFLMWQFDIIYTAIIALSAGLIILTISATETMPKIIYGLFIIIMVLISAGNFPEKMTDFFRTFLRIRHSRFIASEITPYGNFRIHKEINADIYSFFINHSLLFLTSNKRDVQHTLHLSMLQYPWAEKILIIGEGEDIVREALKYPHIKSIYWGSPVPQSFNIIQEAKPNEFLHHDKVRVIHHSDPLNFIRNIQNKRMFDAVIISLPAPTNIFFNRYYTLEFFRKLKSILSDNAMIAIRLNTGEAHIGTNRKFLASSVYKSLKRIFPNILVLPELILASYDRNFTTFMPALAEFLKALSEQPSYISPALIGHKLKSVHFLQQQLNITKAPLNIDSRPSSLRYSLNELLFTFGIFSYPIFNLIATFNPITLYLIITILTFIFIKLISKKSLSIKIKAISSISGFSLTVFIYNLLVCLHSLTGQIFKDISMIFFFLIIGSLTAIKFLKNKREENFLSYIRIYLMAVSIFLILLSTIFETIFMSPTIFYILLLSVTGGFLIGGTVYSAMRVMNNINNFIKQKNGFILYGILAGCVASILIVPIMGTIEIMPILGILNLGSIILLMFQSDFS